MQPLVLSALILSLVKIELQIWYLPRKRLSGSIFSLIITIIVLWRWKRMEIKYKLYLSSLFFPLSYVSRSSLHHFFAMYRNFYTSFFAFTFIFSIFYTVFHRQTAKASRIIRFSGHPSFPHEILLPLCISLIPPYIHHLKVMYQAKTGTCTL